MKKLSLIILAIVIISVLVGCANGEERTPQPPEEIYVYDEKTEENDIVGDKLVLVRTDDILTAPYKNWIWAESYHGGDWLSADGMSVYYKFSEVHEEIPQITYSDDFEIIYASDVSLSYLSIYDDSFAELNFNAQEADLSELEEGIYYLVISVSEQGRYIKAENKYEHSGCECVYKLEVHPKTLD